MDNYYKQSKLNTRHMQYSGSTGLKQIRKTRKGWIGYKVKQVHLREDIPCGLQYCNKHANENVVFHHDPTSEDNVIYFIDDDALIQQTDIIYNCEQIKNIVFLQSSVQKLKKKNLNKYNAFKNYIQIEAVGEFNASQTEQQERSKKLWVFADNYHKQTRQSVKNKIQLIQSQEGRSWLNIQTCAEWYQHHIQQLKLLYKVVILTTNEVYIKKSKTQQGVQIKSLIEFLKENNSSLLDFIGFTDIQDIQNQPIFQEHLELMEAKKKIKQGKLFQGKYMAEKSYFKIGRTIYKIKLQNNRAMFGDIIAIQVGPIQKWQKRTAKIVALQEEKLQVIEQAGLLNTEEANENINLINLLQKNVNLLPKGKVRAIIKRNVKQYCGSLNTQKQVKISPNGWKMFQFKPADDRFPLFYIRTYNLQSIKGKRIQVAFDSWPSISKYPLCHFVRVIGNIGDSRVQGDVILLEHNVQIKEFSRKAYQCLPKQGSNFKIPKEQQQYRLDLRNLDVVSIDPPGCKDIDDALHCIRLPNGNLQIGVHIADVSYYVRPDSALDLQARNRCTTVYLVNRRTDMLPKLLTENLCSLRANVDRLSFSTIWQMNDKAEIINTKYCKTIIRSRKAFTYMQAQQLMESDSDSNIAQSIRNLNKMAKKLKQKRLNEGALTLASTQVKITLQQQTHSATDVKLYEMVQANYLIQQFMLLSNIAVAQKIYQRFPSISILRRHTPPKIGQLQVLKQILSLYNFQLRYENSKALAVSLDKIQKKGDPFFNKLIRILTTRCMNQATYFCSADFDPQQFYHYGLAAPFYTHFTSPIRRYADILVHRLLAAAIDLQPLPNFMINKIKMTKICQKMNMRNRMARYASRASSDYHTYQYFKQKQGEKQSGIITSISQNSVTIMLAKYGLQCKYELNQQQSQKTLNLNKNQGIFNLCFLKGKQRKLFEYVDININVQMQGFHKKVTINII